jgi:hypothetical protein
MNQKFFKKKIEKMAEFNPYFILDGENFAVTGRSNDTVAIATKFNRAHSVGGFCPEVKLYGMLRKIKRGEEVNPEKLEKEIKKFIKDKSFIVAINVAFKALISSGQDNPMNIFIVLPNIVYKYLGKKIIKKMTKIADTDFEFIFSQEALEDDMKMLKDLLSPKEMKEIDYVSKKIEKKHELKFLQDDDD